VFWLGIFGVCVFELGLLGCNVVAELLVLNVGVEKRVVTDLS